MTQKTHDSTAKRSFLMYIDSLPMVEKIPDEDAGKLFKAILNYEANGDEPQLQYPVDMAFEHFRRHLDENRSKHNKISELRSDAGKQGASKRWQAMAKDGKCYDSDSDSDSKDCGSDSSKAKPQPKPKESCADFDRFWSEYPKKVAKPAAQKAFAKVKEDVQVLIDAVKRHKSSKDWTKDGGQFIPHPATWLNQERWNDGDRSASGLEEFWHGCGRRCNGLQINADNQTWDEWHNLKLKAANERT